MGAAEAHRQGIEGIYVVVSSKLMDLNGSSRIIWWLMAEPSQVVDVLYILWKWRYVLTRKNLCRCHLLCSRKSNSV